MAELPGAHRGDTRPAGRPLSPLRHHPVDRRPGDQRRPTRSVVAALVEPDELRRRRQDGCQPLAVREGHGVVVARVREQHARQAARRGDEVEVLEERPQGGGVEARLSTRGPAGRPERRRGPARARPGRRAATRRRPDRAARASGTAAAGRAPPAAACSRPCWPRAPPATARRTRRAAARPRRRRLASRPGPSGRRSRRGRGSRTSARPARRPPPARPSARGSPCGCRRRDTRAARPPGQPAGRKSRPASSTPSEAIVTGARRRGAGRGGCHHARV